MSEPVTRRDAVKYSRQREKYILKSRVKVCPGNWKKCYMAKLQETVWSGGVVFKVERKAETKSSKDLSHFKYDIKCLEIMVLKIIYFKKGSCIFRIIFWKCYEQLCAHKLDNLDDTDKFQERHKPSKLTEKK